MAGYVIGIGCLAFVVWQLWSHRVPPGAVVLQGTVVEEVSRTSTQTGRNTKVHAPRVHYQHPQTGREETYEPSSFGQARFTVGAQTRLVFDPLKDRIFRPLDQPVRQTVVLSLVGIGFIVAEALG